MLKGYFAAVTAMDADVVRLLDRLQALGLRERTMVVFASDNGFSCGHHGFWGKGNGTFPLNMYENSVTVPFLVSQPGRVPQGVVEPGLFSACDLFPTLLEHAGLPEPDDGGGGRSGRSFSGLLGTGADAGGTEGREAVVVDGSRCAEYGASRMVRTRDWKYVDRGEELPAELYHLEEDPGRARQPGRRRGLCRPPPRAARSAGGLVPPPRRRRRARRPEVGGDGRGAAAAGGRGAGGVRVGRLSRGGGSEGEEDRGRCRRRPGSENGTGIALAAM